MPTSDELLNLLKELFNNFWCTSIILISWTFVLCTLLILMKATSIWYLRRRNRILNLRSHIFSTIQGRFLFTLGISGLTNITLEKLSNPGKTKRKITGYRHFLSIEGFKVSIHCMCFAKKPSVLKKEICCNWIVWRQHFYIPIRN